MTELLEKAIERVRALPPRLQDEFAHQLLQMVGEEQEVYRLTEAEKASLSLSIAEAQRGEFAGDDEAKAVWAKHGL